MQWHLSDLGIKKHFRSELLDVPLVLSAVGTSPHQAVRATYWLGLWDMSSSQRLAVLQGSVCPGLALPVPTPGSTSSMGAVLQLATRGSWHCLC